MSAAAKAKDTEGAHLVAACGCYLAEHRIAQSAPRYDGDDTFTTCDVLTNDPARARWYVSSRAAHAALARRHPLRPIVHEGRCPPSCTGYRFSADLRVLA